MADRSMSSIGSSDEVVILLNIPLNNCQTKIIRRIITAIGIMPSRYKLPATPNNSSNRFKLQDKISVNILLATSIISMINWEHISLILSNNNSNSQPILLSRYRILHTSLLGEHQPFLYTPYSYEENILFGIILSI